MWATPLVSLSVSIRGLWKSYWDISSNHEHSDLWEKAICRQEYNKRVVYSKLQCIRMHHGVLSDWSLDWDPKKKALESDWLSRALECCCGAYGTNGVFNSNWYSTCYKNLPIKAPTSAPASFLCFSDRNLPCSNGVKIVILDWNIKCKTS